MKQLLAAVLLAMFASGAFAAAQCPAQPKEKWQKEADFRKQLEGQGYQIKSFKVSGNCYEIHGQNKAGKQVEISFDPVSGKPLRTDIED